MADLDVHWSVIGHLQTNKARYVARFASEFQALDSLRVAEALQRLQLEDRTLDVFVQVNTSAEPSKYGLEPDAVEAFVHQLPAFDRLRVRGLMTLAIFTPEVERVRACFVRLRQLRDQLQRTAPAGIDLSQLSMACPATSKSPSRKVPPWSVSARPSLARAPPRTVSIGPAMEPRHEACGRPATRCL